MTTVNLLKAQKSFSSLLSRVVQKDERIVICQNGKPVADLVAHRPFKRNIKPHPVMSKIKINYDPTESLTPAELGLGESVLRGYKKEQS